MKFKKNQVEVKYCLKELSKRIDQLDNLLRFRGADVKGVEESPIISKLPCGSLQEVENCILETEKFTHLVKCKYVYNGNVCMYLHKVQIPKNISPVGLVPSLKRIRQKRM